ncbi:MAG: phosphoribosylanthranilate isomerase [Bacteroidaceae bacterium]
MQGKSVIIKVCGMRDGNNIREIDSAHPDMMGFICWKGSSRNVSERPTYLPDCQRVGVFVNPSENDILTAKEMLGLNYMQLHGNESETLCKKLKLASGLKLIKAISVSKNADVDKAMAYKDVADMIVFDTRCATFGGSGNKFDWNVLSAYTGPIPFLLSGGIGPEDWIRIREWNHPRCVGIDINSRFESSPASKDAKATIRFINQIRQQNHE